MPVRQRAASTGNGSGNGKWKEWSHEHYLCGITFNEVTSWLVLLHYHYRNKLQLKPSILGILENAKLPAKLHLTRMPITWGCRCQQEEAACQDDWMVGSQDGWMADSLGCLAGWMADWQDDKEQSRVTQQMAHDRMELPQSGLNMNKRYLSKLHYAGVLES